MEITSITIIRGFTACVFLIAFGVSVSIHHKRKKKTNIWLVMAMALLIAMLESTVNAIEWAGFQADLLDTAGEYLSIAFSLVWIYIAYRFMVVDTSKMKVS